MIALIIAVVVLLALAFGSFVLFILWQVSRREYKPGGEQPSLGNELDRRFDRISAAIADRPRSSPEPTVNATPLVGDLNGDGVVDELDVALAEIKQRMADADDLEKKETAIEKIREFIGAGEYSEETEWEWVEE